MTASKSSRWTPWLNLRWVFVAVWMLFLSYPVGAVATSDHSTVVKAVGYTLLCAFALVYLLCAVYLLNGRRADDPRGVAAFTVLAALAAGLLPIVGVSTFGTAPFLMVVAAFTFPTRWAVLAVATLIAASAGVPPLVGWQLDVSVIIILLAVGATMISFRLIAVREGERERAEERQRELNAQLAVVAERERVARDVHDILGHSLTVITIKTELAGRLIDLDPIRAKEELAQVNQLARNALAEVRTTVGQLRTPDLPNTIAAAESALRAADISFSLPSPDTVGCNDELFAWVLREAVTNVVRHSGASRCEVTLEATSITVSDNGRGLEGQPYGNGLRGLNERVEAAGATMSVRSDAHGTTLAVTG